MLTYEEKLNRDTAWALEEGGMHFDRRSAVHETLQRLTKALDDLHVDYAVAGAMAMFMHGFRRFTEVVDVIVTVKDLQKLTKPSKVEDILSLSPQARIFATREPG